MLRAGVAAQDMGYDGRCECCVTIVRVARSSEVVSSCRHRRPVPHALQLNPAIRSIGSAYWQRAEQADPAPRDFRFARVGFHLFGCVLFRRGMRRLEIIKAAGGEDWSRDITLGGLTVA